MSESGATVEYIVNKHGGGRLAARPNDANHFDWLYYFHCINGTLQPAMVDVQFFDAAGVSTDNQMVQFAHNRMEAAFKLIDDRLSISKYLAGPELTSADIMSMYSLTTQGYWVAQANIGPFQNISRWVKDCSSSEAYQRAMENGGPDMELLLSHERPTLGRMAAGSTTSDHWKKKQK